MANSYTTYTAFDALTMTDEEIDEINRLLAEGIPDPDFTEDGKCDPDDYLHCGLEMCRCGEDMAFLCTGDREESSREDHMPASALEAIGRIIARNGKEFITVGYANTCSRVLVASHSGGEFRIHADGRLEYPVLTYKRSSR